MGAAANVELIIENALATADEAVLDASKAADRAISASNSYIYGGNVGDIRFRMSAIEPAVELVADATLTYESQRNKIITLLSGELADFFANYYPLVADAFDEATGWLVDTINNGGTGIKPAVEDQIWQRDRSRVVADGLRAEAQTRDEFAARGFSLPSGAMSARLQQMRFEQMLKTQEQSRDVAVKQADIEVENIRFAVDLAVKSRMQAMGIAVDYIRALMSGADVAARVASLNAEARARMISATADMYRARISYDEVALRAPLQNTENKVKMLGIERDSFGQGVTAQVNAAVGAAEAYGRMAAAALSSISSVASQGVSAFE